MIDIRLLEEVALSPQEYRLAVDRLGREPNRLELGMIGILWSEHCGYKHSKPLLSRFPTEGPRVLQGPGENAGVVEIGDGLAIAMKMESHNHPSAVEPFQGAATGVGGIVRDIFTMGAIPIALFDSLRFGPLNNPRNRYLFGGVVAGVGSYGNCIGVPTVGGEVCFEEGYARNPLVNVMCVGLLQKEHLVRAKAEGIGNLIILVGADTGRDGIHGATFASVELDERSEERRPAVQVGNPFLEKLLIEACLDIARKHLAVAMQDLGAGGMAAAVVESAGKGGLGAAIDVLRVPRREEGMTPYEVMLSESQERMVVIARRGEEDKVRAAFARWGLHSETIGWLTNDGLFTVRAGDEIVAQLPASLLLSPPTYRRQGTSPDYLPRLWAFDTSSLPQPDDFNRTLLDLMASPNIASKEWVYRQYDHMNLTNTLVAPGAGDAAVLRIKGTRKAIAVATDGNGRYCYLDAYLGGAIAVAEAARNVVCVGARPIALTNCLNFGNPEKPEVYYQLEQAIRGMAQACRVLEIPVVSGNVSLYNESEGEAVYPTPVVGMLGILEDVGKRCTLAFKESGDTIALMGPGGEELGGSEYLRLVTGLVAGRPPIIDLELEQKVQRCCLQAIKTGLIRSAHDCSDGGLAIALAESCIGGTIGARIELPSSVGRLDGFLFGEGQSRILVSFPEENWGRLRDLAEELGVPLTKLGYVGGERLTIGNVIDLPVAELERAWRGAIERAMEGAA